MSHAKNKVQWCLSKARDELQKSGNHRGLIQEKPDLNKAESHIKKAEHYFSATVYLKKGNYSDISASTLFYSMYHCLLAIAAKFGYESRNQECTFALIHALIEEGSIELEKGILDKICLMEIKEGENTLTKIREQYQYGTELSLEDDTYEELVKLAKEIIFKTKIILKS